MDTIGLVSCGRRKRNIICTAEEMYISKRFRLAKKYSMIEGDTWFIVSAKHGLLEPGRAIEPYDLWLDNFNDFEKKQWCDNVRNALCGFSNGTKFIILLGDLYAELISQLLSETGYKYYWPLRNVTDDELEDYLRNKLNEVVTT